MSYRSSILNLITRRYDIFVVSIILFVKLVLSLLTSYYVPLSHDEFATIDFLYNTSFFESFRNLIVGDETHPPLFYLFSWIYLQFFEGEVALRVPSLISGLVATWISYPVFRKRLSRPISLLCVLALAFHPNVFFQDVHFRMYGFVHLFSVLLMFYLVEPKVREKTHPLIVSLIFLLASLTHFTLLILAGITLLSTITRNHIKRTLFFFGALIPSLMLLLYKVLSTSSMKRLGWIDSFSLYDFSDVINHVTYIGPIVLFIASCYCFIKKSSLKPVVFSLLGYIVFIGGYSLFGQSIVMERTFFVILPVAILLTAFCFFSTLKGVGLFVLLWIIQLLLLQHPIYPYFASLAFRVLTPHKSEAAKIALNQILDRRKQLPMILYFVNNEEDVLASALVFRNTKKDVYKRYKKLPYLPCLDGAFAGKLILLSSQQYPFNETEKAAYKAIDRQNIDGVTVEYAECLKR